MHTPAFGVASPRRRTAGRGAWAVTLGGVLALLATFLPIAGGDSGWASLIRGLPLSPAALVLGPLCALALIGLGAKAWGRDGPLALLLHGLSIAVAAAGLSLGLTLWGAIAYTASRPLGDMETLRPAWGLLVLLTGCGVALWGALVGLSAHATRRERSAHDHDPLS